MNRLTQRQQDRILAAAIVELGVTDIGTSEIIRDAIIDAAEDAFEFHSLLNVFSRLSRAALTAAKLIQHELDGEPSPSETHH